MLLTATAIKAWFNLFGVPYMLFFYSCPSLTFILATMKVPPQPAGPKLTVSGSGILGKGNELQAVSRIRVGVGPDA